MTEDFRFGVGLHAANRLAAVRDSARAAADMGYDVLQVPDHLGRPAPFPVLAAATAAADGIDVGTFVLNAGFYKPALLARDVETLRDLSAGRFELGLGTGFVEAEFTAADLPFPSAGQRVAHLRRVVEHLGEHVGDVPILLAGYGDRVLELGAKHAAVVSLAGGAPVTEDGDPLAERIAFLRAAAGDRADGPRLHIAITAMPLDESGVPDLSFTRRFMPGLSDEQTLTLPGVLSGSTSDIADTIRGYRERYGVSYVTVQQHHAEAFAKVIAELR